MDKRMNCATCIYLNMHKKETTENGYNYRYGCGKRESGYIPFWLVHNRHDIELITGGCDYCKLKLGFGTMFRFFTENNKYICQYCGRVNGKRLLWNQTIKVYTIVTNEWFSKHRKQIQVLPEKTTIYGCMVTTKEEKQKFHRNMARARKENYLKQCQKL